MIPLDELVQPATAEATTESVLGTLEAVGVPARSWRPGGIARTIIATFAFLFAGFTRIIALAIKAGFLDFATGVWLTYLARYVYGVERIDATYASGFLTLNNAGGGIYPFGPKEARFFNPATKKTYANAEAFTLAALETGKVIALVAEEVGSSSNAIPGSVTGIETSMPGVTCSNEFAIVGSNEELDPDLIVRCRDSIGAKSPNGVRSAYAFFARSTKRLDGSPVDVNRVTVFGDPNTGIVYVRLAAPAGAPAPADVSRVQDSIDTNCRPDSVTATAVGATTAVVNRTWTIWARRTIGVSEDTLRVAAASSLVTLAEKWPIGGIRKISSQGYLYADAMASAIVKSHEVIYDVDGDDTDVPLAPAEVATITPTFVVQFVEAA